MDQLSLQSKVKGIIDEAEAAPYLFIGTGMSKRYVGAPGWEELLRWCASLTSNSFSYYTQQAARRAGTADNLNSIIGSLIDRDFDDIWWNDAKYAEERDKLQQEDAVPTSPLKLQISKKLREVSQRDFPDVHSQELEVLQDATIDGVITTNYDRILETRLFPDYTSYAGQSSIIFSEQYSIAEIYKIHGSVEKPDSLVLTKEDYDDFERKNEYLAAKLITIFLEHPVLFLGYSIQDPDVQAILSSVVRCLDQEHLGTLGKRLIFVEYDEGTGSPELGPYTKQVGARDLRLTRIRAKNYTPIFRALAERRRRMNAKLLRQVKEEMYELVRSSEPDTQLHVRDIEDLDEHDDIEIVVGVGVQKRLARRGLKGIGIDELFVDLVTNGNRFNELADEVVTVTIRDWLNNRRRFVPLFKYMHYGDLLNEDREPLEEELPPGIVRLTQLSRDTFEYSGITEKTQAQYRELSVGEVIDRCSRTVDACRYLSLARRPDLAALQEFLEENLHLRNAEVGQTAFRRLCCIYDRLRYGPGFE